MTNISPRHIKRFLAAAGLALAIPLTAAANPGGHRQPGDCSGMEARAALGKRGGEMGPHYLRGLNLSEAQRDKVFEIMHGQAPLMRDKAKAQQKVEDDLRKLAAAPDYSDAKARALGEALGKSVAERALARAKADRQILEILTPEQRLQLAERKPADDALPRGRGGEGRTPPPAR